MGSQNRKAKIGVVDIETAPAIVATYQFHNTTISEKQVIEDGYILCWTWKELGKKEVVIRATPKGYGVGYVESLKDLRELLDDIDIVVHYNGRRFDIPFVNKEFLKYGIPPYSPIMHVDLWNATHRAFNFERSRLAYVTRILKQYKRMSTRKGESGGFEGALACMRGDKKAMREMVKYNKLDVITTEEYFMLIRDWLPATSGFKRVMEYVNGERSIKC